LGILIVTAFYLLTNFVVIGAVSQVTLASSGSPLINAAVSIFSSPPILTTIVVIVVGVGALLSITGADESGTIGTSRLAYAMSIDGLLPKAFSRTHNRFNTPYLGLVILCTTAYVASLFGGLAALINSSVFLLAVAYLATCISAILLGRRHPEVSMKLRGRVAIPVLGAVFSCVLIVLVNPLQVAISLALLAVGVPVYMFFSPKEQLKELKAAFLSPGEIRRRAHHQASRFLAYPILRIRMLLRRRSGN
jgi:amino acid transporter